jgi:hypothetical protein
MASWLAMAFWLATAFWLAIDFLPSDFLNLKGAVSDLWKLRLFFIRLLSLRRSLT